MSIASYVSLGIIFVGFGVVYYIQYKLKQILTNYYLGLGA